MASLAEVSNAEISHALSRYHRVLTDAERTYQCVSVASAEQFRDTAQGVASAIARHGLELMALQESDSRVPEGYGRPENLIAESHALRQRISVSRFELDVAAGNPYASLGLKDDLLDLLTATVEQGRQMRGLDETVRTVQLRNVATDEYVSLFNGGVTEQAVESVRLLVGHRVPASYANAVHPVGFLTAKMAERICSAYHAGISTEYVKALG